MKFTTTDNTGYRKGIGQIPRSWIDYGLDHDATMNHYFRNKIQIYDADTCGNQTHDFVFEDGKAFRLEYSWYLNQSREVDEDGYELPWVIDEYEIEEINIDEANVPEKKIGRDWI